MPRAAAVIDTSALRHNLRVMARAAGSAQLMAIVKAEAYGHGMVPIARIAREEQVPWLGVALPSEALELRAAGDTGRILAWLWAPGDPDVAACVAQGVDLSISSEQDLEQIRAAARQFGVTASVHVKIDTGLSRNGLPVDQVHALAPALVQAAAAGEVHIVALWSHLASADVPGDVSVDQQCARFADARGHLASHGITGMQLHLANTAAVLMRPDTHFDIVRVGIGMFGVSPNPALGLARDFQLQPVMTLRAKIASVKQIPQGRAVSYGGTWVAERDSSIALIPIGYADGIPRSASNQAHVTIADRRYPIVGRVAMDQFMVNLGDNVAGIVPGDEAVIFGEGGQPVELWGQAADTIGYEIVTRISPRIVREYR